MLTARGEQRIRFDALERISRETPTEDTLHLVEFIRRSERGICRERRATR